MPKTMITPENRKELSELFRVTLEETTAQYEQFKPAVYHDEFKKKFNELISDIIHKINTEQSSREQITDRRNQFRDALVLLLKEFSEYSLRFRYGYFSGYEKPLPFEDQIEVLKGYWPELNADHAIEYVRNEYPKLHLPDWVEGPFAIIRPGFFSKKYTEEVREILTKLIESIDGRFVNYLEGRLTREHLRQKFNKAWFVRALYRQQGENDIVVLPAQFGARHTNKKTLQCQGAEHAVGIREGATMLLTHPHRLKNQQDLWMGLAGDKYQRTVDSEIGVLYFKYNDQRVTLDTFQTEGGDPRLGFPSAWFPQSHFTD